MLSGESSALRRRPRRFARGRARRGGRWVPEGAGCPSAPPPAGCSSRTGRCLMLSHNRVQCSLPTGRRGLWPLMVIRAVFTRSNAMSAAELRPACTQERGAVEFHIPSIGFRTCLRCGRSWSLSVVISHMLADERLPGCPIPGTCFPTLGQGDWGPGVSAGASVHYRMRSPDFGPDRGGPRPGCILHVVIAPSTDGAPTFHHPGHRA